MNTQQVTHAYVGAFVEELARSGLRHVVICPGSRSTPLSMLCAGHPGLRVWLHIDERSAAFFALGMARALAEPVAVVCTSGTAAANFLPAVVEANLSRVPLVVLTADRPHELRDVGAMQTMDQVRLFGTHAKWFVDMALPEATTAMLRYARTCASRAVGLARTAPAGPVHVNFPLREPLVPLAGPLPEAAHAAPAAWGGREGDAPYTAVAAGERTLPPAVIDRLAADLSAARRGVIACGPDTPAEAAAPILELAARLGWPVLADPLSGLRSLPAGAPAGPVIDAYDIFLRDGSVAAVLAPDVIVRFGALPVSKPFLLYLERYAERRQIVVDPGAQWRDPVLAASDMVYADPAGLCRALCQVLEAQAGGGPETSGWMRAWRRLNDETRQLLAQHVEAVAEPFEGRVFHELAAALAGDIVLYVGNSMPIRYMDAFFPAAARRVQVLGNRGVSGIDGVVSSALGAAAASGRPVVLVIGDLSFYHDLNALLAAKLHGLDATIVVVNNDGGGIFSFLPQAKHPEHFETLFGTPIGLDFRPAVEMYGGRFARPGDWASFRAAVEQAVASRGLNVIEVSITRARNFVLHRQLFDAVLAGLGPAIERLLDRAAGEKLAGAAGGPREDGGAST
mgnify:CR=1 FL=1